MNRRSLFLMAAIALVACGDRDPVDPGLVGPHRLVVDGAQNGGNAHFFFLEPLVKGGGGSGLFNGGLSPIVRVCDGAASECAPLAEWSSSGQGGERVRVSLEDERYSVNWAPGAFPRTAGAIYRVEVLIEDVVLGSVEVVFAANQRAAREIEADGYIALPLNGVAPVSFRIEHGALSEAFDLPPCEVDCVEATFEPGVEQTATTPSGQAGVHMDATALDEDEGPVHVSISRVVLAPGEKCLPTDLQQYEGCYRVTANREVRFEPGTVIVGVCLDPSVHDHRLMLYKAEENGDQAVPPVQELEQRDARAFLDCPDPIAFGGSNHPLARLARAGLKLIRPATSLVAPRALYAYDGGMGCDPGSSIEFPGFSRFGWVRPVSVEMIDGDEQTGAPGTLLATDPKVRVWDTHPDPDEPAAGVPVRFEFFGPDQDTTVVTSMSDADGYASAPWMLQPLEGTNTVVVTVPGTDIHNTPVPSVTFTATAVHPAILVSHWTAEGGTMDVLGNNDIDVSGTFGFSNDAMEGSFSFSFPPSTSGGIVSTARGLGRTANSMAAWIKIDASVGQCATRQFVEIVGVGEFRYDACSNEPYRIHYFGGPGPDLSVQNVLTARTCWYHVAVSDGPTRTMYVNGTAIQSLTRNTGMLNPTAIKISENSGEKWIGLIDDVKIWNRELTSTEVQAMYQAGDSTKRCQ